MDELFKTVRESAGPGVWSKGVELARQDSVTADAEKDGEIVLRVAVTGGVSPTVVLHPDDVMWDCSCGGEDPCAHVAAAVISIKRAREQGAHLPQSKTSAGKLRYALMRTGKQLSFVRLLKQGDAEAPLAFPLAHLAAGKVSGVAVAATAADWEIDSALSGVRTAILPAAIWPKVLKALAGADDVTLDSERIKVDVKPVGLVADVTDEGPGVRLRARQDPAIRELFQNGVALCTGSLIRPVRLPDLTPTEAAWLRDGRFFGQSEFGDLVSTVLPALSAKLPLLVTARNLPEKTHVKPELTLHLKALGDTLEITPTIKYADLAQLNGEHLQTKGKHVPIRDRAAEETLKEELRLSFGLVCGEKVVFSGAEALRMAERLGRFRGELTGDPYTAFQVFPPLQAELEIQSESLGVAFTVSGKRAEAGQVFQAWQAGEDQVSLIGGGFAPLPKDWLARFGDQVLDLLNSSAGTKVPRVLWPELARLAEASGAKPPPAALAFRDSLKQWPKPPPLPADLTADLRTYQRDGVHWLAQLKALGLGALLADDMGLGKTLQTIAVISGRTLVVAPTSVIYNWMSELKRFRPALKAVLYHGAARTPPAEGDVVVTTYALLRLDAAVLSKESWDLVVLDETQMIKNPESQAAQAAFSLKANARIALSGTPVENRLDDLWSLMQFLNPGLLGSRATFQERYVRPVSKGEAAATARLQNRIRPFVLRRMKREVAPELPPRTEVVLHVELTPEERNQYDAVRAATRRDVIAKLAAGGNVLTALTALLRLRQACCHPGLLPGGHGAHSAKLGLLAEVLGASTQEGHKALVFSQWTGFLNLMEPALKASGIPYLRLDGATLDRAQVVADFQAPSGPPVLLMSLKAGGVGLNLTAADHVIITDPWWNPAAEDQAADRAHRIGQDRPVVVQRLVALDTVEERILALQARKRSLAAAAIGSAGVAQDITRDDLLALLD